MSEERKKPHPLQRAWAAGVFDARCSFPKSGYVLRFDSVDEPMMRRFLDTVGVGELAPHEKKAAAHTIWIYRTINMDDTRELLLLLSPFLSPKRMSQAAEMLGRIERNPTWRKNNPEKATSSVTVPARPVEAETTPPNTATDG